MPFRIAESLYAPNQASTGALHTFQIQTDPACAVCAVRVLQQASLWLQAFYHVINPEAHQLPPCIYLPPNIIPPRIQVCAALPDWLGPALLQKQQCAVLPNIKSCSGMRYIQPAHSAHQQCSLAAAIALPARQ